MLLRLGVEAQSTATLASKANKVTPPTPKNRINPIHQLAPHLSKIAGYHFDKGDEDFAPSQLVITDIRSGMEVTNVTPHELKMMFNVRNSTHTTQESIRAFFAKTLEGVEHELRLTQGSYPFVTQRDSKIVQAIAKSIEKLTQRSTKLSTAGGTSDARFMGAYGIDVVEFGVMNDTIHALNEYTTIAQVEMLYDIFVDLIENF